MSNFKNRIVFVSGGGRGIGREICISFAKEGATVITCYAGNEKAANDTVKECKKYTEDVLAVKADIKDEGRMNEVFAYIKEKYGRIDILVNNAGITRDNLLIKMSEDEFSEVVDTNLKGAFICTKIAAKMMLTQRAGRIINISSIVGISGNAGQSNYSASKAGLIGFSKSVAKELGRRGITVNVVAPGFIQTDMTEQLPDSIKSQYQQQIALRRFGTAEEVADAVLFLASDSASYITGNVINVDGGMAM